MTRRALTVFLVVFVVGLVVVGSVTGEVPTVEQAAPKSSPDPRPTRPPDLPGADQRAPAIDPRSLLIQVDGELTACLGLYAVVPEKGADPVRILNRNGCYGAMWAPNRSKIAMGLDQDLYLLGASGGKPRLIFETPSHEGSAEATPFTWLPDSRRLVVDHYLPSSGVETFVLDTETLEERLIGRPTEMWVQAIGGKGTFAFPTMTGRGLKVVSVPQGRIFDEAYLERSLRQAEIAAGPRTNYSATDVSPVTGEVLISVTRFRGDSEVDPRLLVVAPDGSARELELPRRFSTTEGPIGYWTHDGDILVNDGRTLYRTSFPDVELQPILDLKAIRKAVPGAVSFHVSDG